MNILLDAWATTILRACWQGGLVVLVVWSICRLIPSMPARFQCWLWRLAILKFMVALLVPWFFNVPLLPAHRMPEHVAEITAVVPAVEIHQEHLNQTLATPVSTPTPVPILPVAIFLLWVIGVVWCLTRLLAALYGTVRLRRQGYSIACTSLIEQLTIQGKLFGLRSLPRLLAVEGDGSPMLVGISRPVILMPATTLGRLSISEQKMVLGHELAHIKRGDLLWSLIGSIVRAVFFFHPLAWWSERQLKLTQEVAADELVIAQQRHDPATYRNLLVSVVGKVGSGSVVSNIAAEAVGTAHFLRRRLIVMARTSRASRRVIVSSSVALGAVVLLGLLPWRLVAADPQAKPMAQFLPACKPPGVTAAPTPDHGDKKFVPFYSFEYSGECRGVGGVTLDAGLTIVKVNNDPKAHATSFAISAAYDLSCKRVPTYRAVAIDKQGRTIVSENIRVSGTGQKLGVTTLICKFPVAEHDIAKFVIERLKD
jgi:beta-lactamase regulating signal transducer with metallopeptidase domain